MKKWFKKLLGIDSYENKIKELEIERLALGRQIVSLKDENKALKAGVNHQKIEEDILSSIKKYEISNPDFLVEDIHIERCINLSAVPYVTFMPKNKVFYNG